MPDKKTRPADAPRRIPLWAWVALKHPHVLHPRAAWFGAWRAWRLGRKHKRKPIVNPGKNVTMYDSVTVDQIPSRAQAVAGYVGGHWPTYSTLAKKFPAAHKLSIAIAASENADCLDIETGDATPAEAPAWVKRQIKRGVAKPVVYTSVSQAEHLLEVLAMHGVNRTMVRLWTAHYTGHPHLCGPSCGFGFKSTADATQYYDRALNRNLDVSLCSPAFFPHTTPV